MAKQKKNSINIKRIQLLGAVVIILLIVLAACLVSIFWHRRPVTSNMNNYRIENKYYAFSLQLPKDWIAEENILYSENNITKILAECKDNKLSGAPIYEIGAFRFENQDYPSNFVDTSSFSPELASGAILQITVDCIPDSVVGGMGDYFSNLKIAGEKAAQYFSDLSGFGKTKQFSFFHDNFQYSVSEYIYILPKDKSNENNLRANYSAAFDKIISTFNFVK